MTQSLAHFSKIWRRIAFLLAVGEEESGKTGENVKEGREFTEEERIQE